MTPPTTAFYPADHQRHAEQVLDRIHQVAPDTVVAGSWANPDGLHDHHLEIIATRAGLDAITQLAHRIEPAGNVFHASIDGHPTTIYLTGRSTYSNQLALRVDRLPTTTAGRWPTLTDDAQLAANIAALVDEPHTPSGIDRRWTIARHLHRHPNPTAAVHIIQAASNRPPSTVNKRIGAGLHHFTDGHLPTHLIGALRGSISAWQRGIRTVSQMHEVPRSGPAERPPRGRV